jgi:hypothetical protein
MNHPVCGTIHVTQTPGGPDKCDETDICLDPQRKQPPPVGGGAAKAACALIP